MADDAILPDDKDWTWVLDRPCPECGFDAGSVAARDVADLIRTNAADFSNVLSGGVDALRARTDPNRWSTLEYSAHVRDVHRLYFERLNLMLDTDDPLYPNWDQDVTAVEDRYNEQDPATVAIELVEAARTLAEAFDRVTGEQWSRPGRRSDGASFTVDSFARYLVHDPIHHLWDVRRG